MVDETSQSALDAQLAGELAGGLVATPMPASVRERLRARVLERAGGIQVVRADAGTWIEVLPGISIKRLRADPATRSETNLWRLRAGAVIPEHQHADDEECLVIEGCIVQDGTEYHAGDYLHARAGSRHVPLMAPRGALLLIRSQPLGSYLVAR